MSLERFLAALERSGVHHEVRGDKVAFRCPLPDHEDRHASAGARWVPADARKPVGRMVLQCRACGRERNPEIVAALGLADHELYDDEPTRPDPSSPRARRGGSRSSSARPAAPRSGAPTTPAPPSSSPAVDKSAPPPPRTPTTRTATYLFTDAAGAPVARLHRFDPIDPSAAGARKSFRWEHPGGPRGGWVRGKPEDVEVPLWRLPEVTTAVAAGARVWLCEGAKNATDLAEHLPAGDVATTPPDGAGAPWSPAYTAVLAGATLTVVADRDPAGYRHAAAVAVELRAAGATVRVVRTPLETDKADASDHLVAGLDVAAFEDVPSAVLGAPAHEGDESSDAGADEGAPAPVLPIRPGVDPSGKRKGGGGGGGGGKRDEYPDVYKRDEYAPARTLDQSELPPRHQNRDALVKITYTPTARELREVLDADVRIVRRLHRDPGDGTDPGTTHVDLEATRDGETVELHAVEWDEFRKCAFLARLPWAVTFRDTPSGRSEVVNAITARSGPVPVVPTCGTLGWWPITGSNGPRQVYVHAGGGIGAHGVVPGVEAAVSPRLRGFTLPAPPEGPEAIAAALDGVLAVLDTLPARAAAPAMGAPLRAMLGEARTSVFLVGYSGSRKSGLAALAQQMHYPAARYDRLPVGAGENAVTPTAMEHLMWEAAHALLVADDLAPDRGAERSAMRANELLRSAANGTAKGRGARTGGLREDRPPQSLLMLTGEDGASRLSAESRTVYVPLSPADPGDPDSGDLPLNAMVALSTRERIAGRNATTAALARHLAARADETPLSEWAEASRDELSAALLAECAHLDSDGLMPRRANAHAELATGWRALLEMARDTGALPAEEIARVWARVWSGLVECLVRQVEVSDRRAMVEHAADLLRSAITSGAAHLEDTAGGVPARQDVRLACGWETFGRPEEGEHRAAGRSVGWTDGGRLWLDPGACFAAIEGQGAAQRDPLHVTPRALTAALLAARLLATEQQRGRRSPSPQPRRLVGGARRRVWDLPWSWLYPDGADGADGADDGAPEPTDGPPPEPTTPPLFPVGPADDGGAHRGDHGAPVLPAAAPPAPAAPASSSTTSAVLEESVPPPSVVVAPVPDHEEDGTRNDAEPAAAPSSPRPTRAARDAQGRSRAPESHADARTSTGPDYRAAAVVVDVDGAWCSDGPAVERPEVETLAELMAWAEALHLGTHHERRRDDAGQVWIMPALARRLGLRGPRPPKDTGRTALAAALTDAGWKVGRNGLNAWTRLYRPGRPSLFLVVVPWLTEHEMCTPADPPPGDVLAERIGLVRDLIGQPYVWSGSATGAELVKLCHSTARKGRLTEPIEQPPPAMADRCNRAEREWAWTRTPGADELAGADRVVVYDLNAQYLAAAAITELGIGSPDRITDSERLARAVVDDPRRLPPGYWLITHPTSTPLDARLPDLLDPAPHTHPEDNELWVTTPSLRAVLEAGYVIDPPREAWVWIDHTCWLKAWAERLRDARYELTDLLEGVDPGGNLGAALAVVKLCYSGAIGLFGSVRLRGPSKDRPQGSVDFRPDARHHVIGTSKANAWRKVITGSLGEGGRYPIALTRDALVYLAGPDDDDTTPPAGITLGTKLGNAKIENVMSISEGLARYGINADTVED